MKRSPAVVAVLAALLVGCEAGTTEISGARVVSFTAQYLAGTGCALFGDGSARCRGDNTYGQLGIGTAVQWEYLPENEIPVEASARFTTVATGDAHACALDGDGAAWCWGSNISGQLGISDTTGPEICEYSYGWPVIKVNIGCAARPVRVETSLRFKRLIVSDSRSCGLTSARELWCWGYFGGDRFGRGTAAIPAECTPSHCSTPVRAALGLTFRKVVMESYGSCGIASDLVLYCWGEEQGSRFGRELGVPGDNFTPIPINSDAPIGDVAISFSHTCTVTTAGALICFGANFSGQLGDGTTASRQTPQQWTPAVPFRVISVTSGRSCALDEGGEAWCWGDNRGANLGLGHLLPALFPTRVLGDLSFRTLQVGTQICATQRGDIWCWGQLPSRFEQ